MATQALAVNGAKVYIVGRTEDKLTTVAEKYGQGIEGAIIPITADISSKDSIKKLVSEIESREKCVCILINNAGIAGPTFNTEAQGASALKEALFDDDKATFDDWTDTYRTNVAQIYFMTTAFLPLLQHSSETHKGFSATVINITSISGIVKLTQHHPAYNASKAAAIHLSNMLAHEVHSSGLKIRINNIAPGVFPSEMTTSESDDAQKSQIAKSDFEGKVPANRPGKDADMASAILFVATNQYLNAQTIAVDGGYILGAGAVY